MGRAGDSIDALVCGIASPKRERRIMVMLAAYLDETGNDPNDRLFAYAGFVATSTQWKKFSNAWQAECNREPATPNFHMVRAWRLRGKDAYWGTAPIEELTNRRDRRLLNLAAITKKNVLFRISSGLDLRSYEKYLKGVFPYAEDTPLFVGFISILAELVRWHKQDRIQEKIDVFFDTQSRIQKYSAGWYEFMLEHVEPYAAKVFSGPPSFRKDDDLLPLKAADMLAWQAHRHVVAVSAVPDEEISKIPSLKRLLEIPHRTANVPTHFLRTLARSYVDNLKPS